MNDWRKPCEHQHFEVHDLGQWGSDLDPYRQCPGGSPVTTADLEKLGEKVWWCDFLTRHYYEGRPASCYYRQGGDGAHNDCGWRILILDSQPAEEGSQ